MSVARNENGIWKSDPLLTLKGEPFALKYLK